LGNSAYSSNNWVEAVKAYRQATELEPLNITAWNNLAYALLAHGQNRAALEALQQALSLSPDDVNLLDSQREIGELLEAD
jgi:Flp pilus assembly protein TadD